MAKWGIFEYGDIRAVALTDAEKDSLMEHRGTYVAKEFTDAQADACLNVTKEFKLDGEAIEELVVDWNDSNANAESGEANFKAWVEGNSSDIYFFLQANKTHPDYSEWETIKTKVDAIDISSITFPLTQSPQQWFSAQSGNSSLKKMLQLP